MTAGREPRLERSVGQGKARDRALVLPLVGLVLLVPPVAAVFELHGRVLGVPFTALYLFVVWALLIVGAALLAGPLRAEDDGGLTEDPDTDGNGTAPPGR